MDLTNCKRKVAIIYTSVTGNTAAVAEQLYQIFLSRSVDISLFRVEAFELADLFYYDAIVIGTYTWGNGDIPQEMEQLYHTLESDKRDDFVTGVFGTGDSFYPHFCGAVDLFRDMMYVHTNLAVTMKVEISLQKQDVIRCHRFVEAVLKRIESQY